MEDYAEPVQELFNNVTTLNHRENSCYSVGTDISSGAESLLRIILQDIGLDKFEIPEELEVSDKKVDEKVDKDE